MRKLTEKEKLLILNKEFRNPYPLYILIFACCIVIPYFVCMIITGNYTYWYLNLVFVFILLLMVCYQNIMKRIYLRKDIECFEGEIVKTNKGKFYLYEAYVNDIDYKFPVHCKFRSGKKVMVAMLKKGKYSTYVLFDKVTGNILSTRKTWFDITL